MTVTNSSVATHLPKQLLLDTHNALVSETIPMQGASGRFGKLNATVTCCQLAWLLITNNPPTYVPGLLPMFNSSRMFVCFGYSSGTYPFS